MTSVKKPKLSSIPQYGNFMSNSKFEKLPSNPYNMVSDAFRQPAQFDADDAMLRQMTFGGMPLNRDQIDDELIKMQSQTYKRPRRANPIVITAKRDVEVQTDPVYICELPCEKPGIMKVPEPSLNNWFSLNASVKGSGNSPPSKRDSKLDGDRFQLQVNDSAPQFGGRRMQKKQSKEDRGLGNLISK
jgi:hypothetical protein